MTTIYYENPTRPLIEAVASAAENVGNTPFRRGLWDSIYDHFNMVEYEALANNVRFGSDPERTQPLLDALDRLMPILVKVSQDPDAHRPDPNLNPHWYVTADNSAETAVAWLESIQGYGTREEAVAATAGSGHTLSRVYSFVLKIASFATIKRILSNTRPHIVVESTQPERDTWGGHRIRYSINPEEFPERDRRFLAQGYFGTVRELNIGRPLTYDSLYVVNDDGVLERTNTPTVEVYRINAGFGVTREEVEQNITAARQEYRNSVLRRLGNRQVALAEEAERDRVAARNRTAAAERFIEYRRKQDRKLLDADHGTAWITTLPFVPNGVRASRNWGIEIETGAGRDLSGTPRGWDSKDDGSLESAYGGYRQVYVEPEDCYWAEQHDIASMTITEELESEDGDTREVEVISDEYRNPSNCDECGWVERENDYEDDDCVELVSPILSSMHSRGLKQICSDLEHAPRTESAGIHVHVDAADLTVAQIRELVLGYDHIEHLLESSYDREERGYCKRRSPQELLEVARSASDPAQTKESMRKGDRYVTVNLQALNHHGTVEFRAMGPKYTYDHLVRWAMFCREMLNAVKAGAKSKDFAKVKNWADVEAIFAKFGTEYNLAVGAAEPVVMTEAEDMVSV